MNSNAPEFCAPKQSLGASKYWGLVMDGNAPNPVKRQA